jgi:hypothetical protein
MRCAACAAGTQNPPSLSACVCVAPSLPACDALRAVSLPARHHHGLAGSQAG